jgi:hypothetical protein
LTTGVFVKRKWLAAGLVAAGVVTAGVVTLPALAEENGGTDITGDGGTVSAEKDAGSPGEGIAKLVDDDPATKYLTHNAKGWMQYEAKSEATVGRYTLTSANDAPDRDPLDWTLSGSTDGTSWKTLDKRSGEVFAGRGQQRGFVIAEPGAYTFFRLDVTANGGSPALQLAEWELWAGGDRTPAAPTGLTGTAISGSEIDLGWTDNSSADTGYPETGFAIERSDDGGDFTAVATVDADVTSYTDRAPLTSGERRYRVKAVGDEDSGWSNTATVTPAATGVDITDFTGTLSDQYASTGREGVDQAADNALGTKYYTGHTTTWIRHSAATRSVVDAYTIASGNDAPDRDPKSWVLEGSADGTTWTALDTRTGQTFGVRLQRKRYAIAEPAAYPHYRLRITANNGASGVQLSEWEIFGTGTSAPPVPAAPSGLSGTAVSGDQAVLTWTDADRWETSFRLERSENGTTWTGRDYPAGTTKASALGLTGDRTYRFRVRATGTSGNSAYSPEVTVKTGAAELPATWKEHWLEHDQLVTRVYQDADLAVYFDPDVSRDGTAWLYDYTGDIWRYTKKTYGDFSNPRLAAIFHQGRYGGGHPATVFDSSHDYRNVTDIGLGSWTDGDQARDITSHEIAHIVEGSASGVKDSPAFGLWGDSKWAEIFQYDAYVGTGLTADAERWKTAKMASRDDFPRAGTAWFRDWFYPIWKDHGGSKALAAYFTLLSENYPAPNGVYARSMNWGEFVHFWSGAAGTDLQPQAEKAFGWSAEWQAQLDQAKAEFPAVRY